MATKTELAALAQVELIKAELADKCAELAAMAKKLENAERAEKYASMSASELRNEVTQINGFLDAMPNSPPREAEYGSYGGKTVFTTLTRLMVYIATRGA